LFLTWQAALDKVGQADDADRIDGMLEYARTELGLEHGKRGISFEDFQRLVGHLWNNS